MEFNAHTVVVNRRFQRYDHYIGRGSKWGNPFHIGEDGTRNEVIEKYREWFARKLDNDYSYILATRKLKGKRLGCFCKPRDCHGDVIVEYLDG